MPSSTGRQHRFFGMASTPAGRARLRAEGKTVPPLSVAKEYLKADKGRHFARAKKRRP